MENETTPRHRGEATRQRLVITAIEIFGRDGFHAASTREIAKQAGVNQALIGYHFGGKEPLYIAAMEHIARQIRRRLAPVAEEIDAQLEILEADTAGEGRAAREKYLDLLLRLIDGFVHMLVDEESSSWARLILREQQSPSPAFDVLYEAIMKKLLQLATHLTGRVRGIDPSAEEARLLALTIFGQAVIFRASRATVLKHMGWTDVTSTERTMIQQQIRHNISILLLMAGEPS
jgi:AcrR family transcriptional regulator